MSFWPWRKPTILFLEFFLFRYASTVLDICKTNEDLNSYLRDVSQYTAQLGNQEGKYVL